jgi:hypothetical protein
MEKNNNKDLMRYAGMATQIFVSLGATVFIGYRLDDWLDNSTPLLVWLLPLVVLCVIIYKLIQETSKRKDRNDP